MGLGIGIKEWDWGVFAVLSAGASMTPNSKSFPTLYAAIVVASGTRRGLRHPSTLAASVATAGGFLLGRKYLRGLQLPYSSKLCNIQWVP